MFNDKYARRKKTQEVLGTILCGLLFGAFILLMFILA